MKRRTPVKKVGARGKRLAPVLAEMRRIVRRRSGGMCERRSCVFRAAPGAHHVFGRGGTGARLGDRWANDTALCTDLCQGDHDLVTRGDQALDYELKWAAICRLAVKYDWGVPVAMITDNLNDFVRGMVRDIEAKEKSDG